MLLSRLDLSVLTIVTGYITCKFLINFLIKEGINKIQGHFIKNKNLRVCFIKKKNNEMHIQEKSNKNLRGGTSSVATMWI